MKQHPKKMTYLLSSAADGIDCQRRTGWNLKMVDNHCSPCGMSDLSMQPPSFLQPVSLHLRKDYVTSMQPPSFLQPVSLHLRTVTQQPPHYH